MESCLVLKDALIHELLMNLSADEIHTFLGNVGNSLIAYSVGNERAYQPAPGVINRPDGRRNLFRCFTSPTGVGVKIIVDAAPALQNEQNQMSPAERNRLMGLHGLLALCDENGFPTGFMNAEEITGYRTSLSAMLLYVKRKVTSNIVVFGTGKQALWHIRLALALRGQDIKQITIVNRTSDRTKALIEQLKKENQSRWKASVDFKNGYSGDHEVLKDVLARADVVFCTTPSKQVLFPANWLEKQEKGCYVSAIGSWQPEMIELDPELLKNAAEQGLLVVDDCECCLKDAGEVIQSKLSAEKLVEVGQILGSLNNTSNALSSRTLKCLEDGFMVYKSIGVSLTDLATGQALLEIARKKHLGLSVPDF